MVLKLRYVLVIIIIAVHPCSKLFAQHHISSYEYRWAVFHPFAALKIKQRLPQAMNIYREVSRSGILDTLNSGGKLDAFRHAYTMAFLARNIRVAKLRKLGKAHEKGNKKQFEEEQLEDGERPDSLACDMDLKNNELGYSLGFHNKKSTDEALKMIMLQAIKEGKAVYLKRNNRQHYVTCANEVIDVKNYKGIWFIPKCLIKTNE